MFSKASERRKLKQCFSLLCRLLASESPKLLVKKCRLLGTWVAQSVGHLTLDLSLGFDLRVMRSCRLLSPCPGCVHQSLQKVICIFKQPTK